MKSQSDLCKSKREFR